MDPLAAALAGSEGMRAAVQLARPWGSGSQGSGGSHGSSAASPPAAADASAARQPPPQQQQQQQAPQRRFCFSNVSTRVWWFDRRLTAALAAPSQPRQIVVLGAGLDTRPWRMALPPGMRWWEVDMPHVVAGKRRQLEQLGAALSAAAPAAHAHPLRAAAWQAVPADLGQPGWGEALQAAGLDASRPVVWVAEGELEAVGSSRRSRTGAQWATWQQGLHKACTGVSRACTVLQAARHRSMSARSAEGMCE